MCKRELAAEYKIPERNKDPLPPGGSTYLILQPSPSSGLVHQTQNPVQYNKQQGTINLPVNFGHKVERERAAGITWNPVVIHPSRPRRAEELAFKCFAGPPHSVCLLNPLT